MRSAEPRGRHLTPDEIVARVFPSDEGTAPVPLHLAVCHECQARVAELREGWLLDRGAVAGAVEAMPEAFWRAQTDAILEAVKDSAAEASHVHPFPFQRSFFRHPLLAIGSVAAALLLVASMTILKPWTSRSTAPAAVPQAAAHAATPDDTRDDELLRDVDRLLAEDTPFSSIPAEGAS